MKQANEGPVCVLAAFATGLWVQPPRAICPAMPGHMWPLAVWITVTAAVDANARTRSQRAGRKVACFCMCSNVLN